MDAYIVPRGCREIEELRPIRRPDPRPAAGQVLLRVRAASLNYRDQAIVAGTYAGGAVAEDTIPLSDGAGEVAEVGPGVTRFKPGDRVAGTFFQRPPSGFSSGGRAALGWPLDGMLAEQVLLDADGVVAIPRDYSFEEAACLPCAAVTAWHALVHAGKPVRTGDTVLVLGTGGVSIFALQFARAGGARVIATSSSDDKIDRLKTLGACDAVNYKTTPDWEQRVVELTGGRGVDCVVEIGGAGTLNRSFQTLAAGGKVVLIGMLAERDGNVNPYVLMGKNGSLHGVFVGDRDMFEEMNRAIDVNRIKPVVDRVFSFDQAVAAYRHHQSGQFVGKVVIAI